jgi:AhpD family alkylhydroperoxidase
MHLSHLLVSFRHMDDEPDAADVTVWAANGAVTSETGGRKIAPTQGAFEMQARMKNPAMILPDAMKAILALKSSIEEAGVPAKILELAHLRASQINGCGFCVDMGARSAKKAGETDERLFAVAAWREAPYFTDAERAALALTEAATRLSDRADPVPDAIWEEAKRHFDERALAGLILSIAMTNLFNRINVPIRQIAGSWS